MLGPVFVHQKKTFESYHFLASSLISLVPSVDTLLVFGKDGEELSESNLSLLSFFVVFVIYGKISDMILISDMGVKEDDAQ